MLAEDQVQIVSAIVAEKLQTAFGWAQQARQAAYAVIAAIGQFPVPQISMGLPDPPLLGKTKSPSTNNPPNTVVNVAPVQATYFETDQVGWVAPPELPPLTYGVAVVPPPAPTDGVPTPPTLYPQAAVPSIPDQPALASPAEPTIDNASPPALLYVDVPDFTFPILPAFGTPFPTYVPPPVLLPVAPIITYPTPVPQDIKDRVVALLEGGEIDGVREAMIDKMVENIDQGAQKAVEDAFTGAAARNFSMPNGTLIDSVNDIRYVAAHKVRDGMSDINNQLAKQAFANYQAGMELALVLEKAYVSWYLEYAHQVLEAEKLNVQVAIEMFNAAVALFNAQQQARQIHASAHRAQVEGIIAGMGAYPVAIDGAIAETAENEQRVQMYAADGGLVKARAQVYSATTRKAMAPVETYKAEVDGVRAQAEIIAANVDSYRAAVSAYATGVSATTEVIEAFAHETEAKASQVSVYGSNAKAYSQYVQEGARRANTWKTFSSSQGDVLRANMQSFQSAADANQAFVRAQSAAISAEAEIAQARASAYGAGLQAVKVYNRATMDNVAAAQQFAMIAAENVTRAQTLASIAQAETDRINAGAMAAQTEALASLAQGAMSALHVSAGAEGSGAIAANADWSQGASQTWGGSVTHSELHEEQLSA